MQSSEHESRQTVAIRFVVNIQIFIASYGTCCIYFVFLADNTRQLLSDYSDWSQSTWIIVWLLPVRVTSWREQQFQCILLCMIRQLKTLAIPALIADVIYLASCLVTFQYLLYNLPD